MEKNFFYVYSRGKIWKTRVTNLGYADNFMKLLRKENSFSRYYIRRYKFLIATETQLFAFIPLTISFDESEEYETDERKYSLAVIKYKNDQKNFSSSIKILVDAFHP